MASLLHHGLPPPLFEIDSGCFIVTLLGEEHAWHDVRISPEFLKTLDTELCDIIKLLMKQGRITSNECAEHFRVDKTTARKYLRKLKDLGIIESRGRGPRTYYVLAGM